MTFTLRSQKAMDFGMARAGSNVIGGSRDLMACHDLAQKLSEILGEVSIWEHPEGNRNARRLVVYTDGRSEHATPHPDAFTLAELERDQIQRTLLATGGAVPESARVLGIAVSTLYRKLGEYGIRTRAEKLEAAA